ncbi:MAG TPA: hypothetical protein VH229_12585, partial [Candidatus Udaeobacter sp.]|nr:hypothetical protein [Candidatus Udaeobacter sp.]
MIVSARWIEFGILFVEFGVGICGLLYGRAISRIEWERWRPAETETPYEREAGKHVGPDQCAIAGHERALVVSHHHRCVAVAERRDERNLVAQQIESKKGVGVRIPGIVPAGRAAKPTTIGGDR